MTYRARPLHLALIATAFALAASAQTITPKKGQSADQQKKDVAECSQIATNQTGFNPSAPPPPPPPQGGRAGSGAKGAAAGAVSAGASGGDAGQGAVAGAVVGRGMSRRDARRDAAAAGEQQAGAGNAYNQSLAACLGGKGYTVK